MGWLLILKKRNLSDQCVGSLFSISLQGALSGTYLRPSHRGFWKGGGRVPIGQGPFSSRGLQFGIGIIQGVDNFIETSQKDA